MTNWDFEYDVIVVGSGASGFAAAITAKNEGLKTLLIEKEKVFGGASALSGGGVWVPNNRYLQEAGVADSYEEAKTYLDSTVGDRVSDEMKETYLKRGIEMLDYLHGASKHLRYSYANNYSDYYPHRDGGKGHGRSIEPLIFDLNELKDWKMIMRPPAMDTKGFVMNGQDFHKVNMITRTWAGKFRSLTLGWRLIQHKVFKKELAALGQALIGRLALAYKELDGELWVNSAFKDFIYENDRVIGIMIEKHGKPFTIKANRGVILGSGGFSRNQQFRERFLPAPTKMEWSSSPEGQTGDIITPAEKLGAKFDLMNRVWGAPSFLDHNGNPFFLVADRGIPSMIIVDQEGNRFVDEPTPYHEFVDVMYEHNAEKPGKAIHSWLILDKRTKKRYIFAGQFPGQDFPKEYYDAGVVLAGDSIAELEKKMDVPVGNLTATVDRFNGFAREGVDLDFGRGENAHDRYYGDPTLKNPNLDTIEHGPYYAVRVFPGDIGTKGGVVIDRFGRVMKEDDTPIAGVYAIGNCSASVMGESYPGPGATLGPGMTFGYIAAKHCLEQNN